MAAAAVLVYLTVVVAAALSSSASGQELTPDYYSETCPLALSTIKFFVGAAILREPRMGASLVRMHFHDCFVNVSYCTTLPRSFLVVTG
jgi:peroxidase